MGKKEGDYFTKLQELAERAVGISAMTCEVLGGGSGLPLEKAQKEARQLRREAGVELQLLVRRLEREFITPIDREDILGIGRRVERVVCCCEEMLARLALCRGDAVKWKLKSGVEAVAGCCGALEEMMRQLPGYQKPEGLYGRMGEMRRRVESGRELCREISKALFVWDAPPQRLMAVYRLLEQLEGCLRACEEAAGAVEIVIVKGR